MGSGLGLDFTFRTGWIVTAVAIWVFGSYGILLKLPRATPRVGVKARAGARARARVRVRVYLVMA